MEVGRGGEIILVRLPPTTQATESPPVSNTTPGASNSTASREVGRGPQGYRGGWEWGIWGKRFSAGVSCGVVGLIGWIIGNYFAELPDIQKHLDLNAHVASLGNSMFFLALALTSFLLWPLPLLHGRKPYLLMSISLLLPLQLPQALSLPPYTTTAQDWNRSMQPYVVCLIFFRTLSGIVLGFGFINSFSTIVDLFGPDTGACCRGGVVYNTRIPMEGHNHFHQVPGGESGVRIGIWLGVYTWFLTSSPGFGFLFGKITVSKTTPAWGFWIVAILGGSLLMLIILIPEVRPPWTKVRLTRRTSRNRRTGRSARVEKQHVERGELGLVMFGKSPRWWWQEVWGGLALSAKMFSQIGFMGVAIYVGWVFGHLVVVMRLLASLIMSEYKFNPSDIGLAILALPLGSLLCIPTQLSLFYIVNFRHRSSHIMSNRNYGHSHQGKHPYRWALWIGGVLLPISSTALSIAADGPPTHFMVPVFFAAVLYFAGTLAITECFVVLMDNFDISDLPEPYISSASGSISQGANHTGYPHGTQRPSSLSSSEDDRFTTSHPCLSAALAITHGLAFSFGAMAEGISPHIIDEIGVRKGLGVMAGFTVLFTLVLMQVLWRNKEVRLAEVFDSDETELSVKVCLLQRG
ncbi:major facilitator superfamily domain-containing protein [Geopyxis carbonaria]|nr:major facilitator superfamily domain-containing protein [Geopyxis carbonaria]